MAGAVGSSSMAGIAASVNKDLRVRVAKRSGAISQHDGGGRSCGEKVNQSQQMDKMFPRRKGDQR